MPPGGLGPTPGPSGAAILSQAASVGSSEGDGHNPAAQPGKRREPWMMNAAQNLVSSLFESVKQRATVFVFEFELD